MSPIFSLVTFFCLIVHGYAQILECYDCDPRRSSEECINPVRSGVQQTNCNGQFLDRHPNSTLLCMSAFVTFMGERQNETGIYRGCRLQNETVVDYCDLFKEEVDNQIAILTSCETCNNTRCNNITFTEDGQPQQPQPNSGSSLFTAAATIVIVTILFGTLF